MTIHETNKVYVQNDGDQVPVEKTYAPEKYPSISKIEDHFRQDLDPDLSTAEQGVHLLLKAGGGGGDDGKKLGLIDAEIQRLSREIREERDKEKPNWTKIDHLIRQLGSYMLRKAGKADQELTQAEIDRMREDIEKVKGTYNTTWSLITAIGSGSLSIIGGLIGIGGNSYGLHQLAKGANKVSKTVQTVTQLSSGFSSVGQGIQTAAGQPLSSYYQGKQQGYNFELQLSTHRKDSASASSNQYRQMQQGSTSNLDRLNENMHSAAMRVFQ